MFNRFNSFQARLLIATFVSLLAIASSISGQSETPKWKELLDRADSLSAAQNQDSAIVVGQQALELAEKEFGKEDTVVALVLHRLGLYNDLSSNYAGAGPLYQSALAIRERLLGPEHPSVASSLNDLADLYVAQGKYAEAEPLFQRALAIREKVLGPENTDVAGSLSSLAYLYLNQGKYAEAEPLHQRALAIDEKTLGPEHPNVAFSLNALASLYQYQGKYAEAEPLHQRALTIFEKVLGPEHPDLARGLTNLASLYQDQGKYTEAEPHYRRALAIREKALGPEHTDVAQTLNNLAIVYWEQGMYAEAEPLYQRALAINEKTLGSGHPYVARILNNLAILHTDLGKYAEAEPLNQRALTISEKALGPEHPDVASGLFSLGQLFQMQGELMDAETFYLRALTIREKSIGPEHPDVALSLNNLAILYRDQGKYAEAEPLFKRALAIFEKALGPEHLLVAESKEGIAKLNRFQRKMLIAIQESDQALRIREKHFLENAHVLSERDALTFFLNTRSSSNIYLSCYFDCDSLERSDEMETASVTMKMKGQVSDMVYERRMPLVTETDSTTLALAESLRLNQFLLSKIYVSGPDDNDTTGQYKHKLDSLSALTKKLESDLARKSASFAKFKSSQDISVDRIVSLMPEKSVLLEYLKYDYLQLKPDTNIPHYLVVALGNTDSPDIIDLGAARPIDSLIAEYKNHSLKISQQQFAPTKKQKEEYQTIAQRIYNATVRPVEKHLSGKELVIVAPDGALNLVSFAGLIDEDGKYLIEKYPIHYLSAGRDLIRLSEPEESGQNLLAIGDPDYNATVATRLGKSDSALYASVNPDEIYTNRNVRSGCGDLSSLEVKSLPYTRKEVEAIVQHWNASKKDKAAAFFGPQASEENFKSESKGKRIIHLATHGYYLEEHCNPEQKAARFGEDAQFIGENPLLLSGLLFAGANLHGQGADSVDAEDGILSAYEVSAMNLHGTDMVVLSACETGLGEVKEGEGVYGLRRAFQMAGARTVVSALWPVSDKETASMMSELYTESNETLPEKMRRIQLAKINQLREGGFADHPFTWGAFIAMGDWR